jgi:heme/copper-type cytochrome/quinol oxidase subunit 2
VVVAAATAATAATDAAATDATGTEVRTRGLRAGPLVVAAFQATAGAAPPATLVELRVSSAGFVPARVVLHRGEPARLVVTSGGGEHCFAIDALRVEKRVTSGRPTTVELLPERSGTFVFHCCLESGPQAERERGELVVTE